MEVDDDDDAEEEESEEEEMERPVGKKVKGKGKEVEGKEGNRFSKFAAKGSEVAKNVKAGKKGEEKGVKYTPL